MTTRRAYPLWTVLGAILASLAIVPSARAGCAHPGGVARPAGAQLEQLAEIEAEAPAAPAPPSPCRGLRCSGVPASTPILPLVEADDLDRWISLAAPASPPGADPSRRLSPPRPLAPSHGGPAPFHPPR